MRHVFYLPRGGVWVEASDFWPVGRPETTVELPGDVTLGLHVTHPFGERSDAMLQVRAIRGNGKDGGNILLSIGTVMCPETTPPMDMRLLQSNPRRWPE